MNLPGPVVAIAIALFPLILFIAFTIRKGLRKKREREAAGDAAELAFESATVAVPNAWLRRFSPAEQAYLLDVWPSFLAMFRLNAWLFFVLFCSGLLPQFRDRYSMVLAQRVWFSYLLSLSAGGFVISMMAMMSAVVANSNQMIPAQARFVGTRPLSRRFLFWAKAGPALGSLVGALVVAAGCSFLMLLTVYGPVWRHRWDAAPMVDGHLVELKTLGHMLAAAQSSPWLMVLSGTTSMLLFFSFALVMFNLPVKWAGGKLIAGLLVWFLLIGNAVYTSAGYLVFPRFTRAMFLYPHPGPPPPLQFCLVPLAASVVLLGVAQFFAMRREN